MANPDSKDNNTNTLAAISSQDLLNNSAIWPLLAFWQESGIDSIYGDDVVNRLQAVKKPVNPVRETKVNQPVIIEKQSHNLTSTNITAPQDSPILRDTVEVLKGIQSKDELRDFMAGFEQCPLQKTAKNMVFGDGAEDAPLMVIGEAPGADEDRQGLPFVGASGQLLDKMLAAIGCSRETNAYITNIVPWRPPGNRQPTLVELNMCTPFIEKHIALHRPKAILALGGTAMRALLSHVDAVQQQGITKNRGAVHPYKPQYLTENAPDVEVMIGFHPAYLLRAPQQKRLMWQDLLLLQKSLA